MSYDEGGLKRKVVNGVIAIISLPLYPFKKMRDYSKAVDEIEEEEE
jgi:hypothetical protein